MGSGLSVGETLVLKKRPRGARPGRKEIKKIVAAAFFNINKAPK